MKVILVPQDLNQPIRELEGSDYRELITSNSNIDWIERVNTPALNALGLVAALDESGASRTTTHHMNLRGMHLTRYLGAPLYGDMVFLREEMGPEGIDFASVSDDTLGILRGLLDD